VKLKGLPFAELVAYLLKQRRKTPSVMVTNHGQLHNNYFYRAGQRSGRFKANQRKERKAARRRKMPPRAR